MIIISTKLNSIHLLQNTENYEEKTVLHEHNRKKSGHIPIKSAWNHCFKSKGVSVTPLGTPGMIHKLIFISNFVKLFSINQKDKFAL